MLTTHNNIPTEQINLNRLDFFVRIGSLTRHKVMANRKWIVEILKECNALKEKMCMIIRMMIIMTTEMKLLPTKIFFSHENPKIT